MNPYKFKVFFKKTFLTGNLKGLSVEETCQFASDTAALRFIDSLEEIDLDRPGVDFGTKAKYIVSDIYIKDI